MMYFEKPDETGFKDRFKLREFVLVERATPAPAPAQEPVTLTKDEIRDVFLAAGFTIKEGHPDLKPYVFKAADDLIAALRAKGGKL